MACGSRCVVRRAAMRSRLLFAKRSRIPAGRDDARSHLLVESIEDGVLNVRGDGPRIGLEAGGVNFDLKSESEQRALLDVMAELLSYLPGPLQILVRSRAYEPDEYFETLHRWQRTWEAKADLRTQRLAEYRTKLRCLVQEKRIKDRRVYIIVPFSPPPVPKPPHTPSPGRMRVPLLRHEERTARPPC